MSEIAELWAEHCKRRFPRGLSGEEIRGVELVLLDSDIAGCVSCAEGSDGKLDRGRLEILSKCYQDLLLVLPELNGEGRLHFDGLEKMARIVLEKNGWKRKQIGAQSGR